MVSSLFNNPKSSATPQQVVPTPAQAPAAQAQVPSSGSQAQTGVPGLPDITMEELKLAVPPHLRNSVSQQMLDNLNAISQDPIHAENIRNNFVSYTRVLQEGKFKLEDYLNAVTYVSFKLMGFNNEEAYAKTFPHRYAALLAKNTSKKDIGSYVSAFHKGKLVNLIMEQCLTPTWVLNQDLFQKALNKQAELMMTASSEKVQMEAAHSLLTHLQRPKENNFQVNINQTEHSGMKEMREMMAGLAQQQKEIIAEGRMKTIDVASARLISDDEE